MIQRINRYGVPLIYRDFPIPVMQGVGLASYQMWGVLQSRFNGVMVASTWQSPDNFYSSITGIVGYTFDQKTVSTAETFYGFNTMTSLTLEGFGGNGFSNFPVFGCGDFAGNPTSPMNLSTGEAYFEIGSLNGQKTSVVMPGNVPLFDVTQNVYWGGASSDFSGFSAEILGYTLADDGFIYTLIGRVNAPSIPYLMKPFLLKSPAGFRSNRQNATTVAYEGTVIAWPPPAFPAGQAGAWLDPASGYNQMWGQIPFQGQALGGLYWWEGANRVAGGAGTWRYFLNNAPTAVQTMGPRVGDLLWSLLFIQAQFFNGSTVQTFPVVVTFFRKAGKQYMGIGWCPQPALAGLSILPNMEPWLKPRFVLCNLTDDLFTVNDLTLSTDIPASVVVADVAQGDASYYDYTTIQNPLQIWYTETGGMRAIILDIDGSACWVCHVGMETIGHARTNNFGYGVRS